MSNKLQKIAPAWHEEAKKLLVENFEKINSAFLDSTKRAVWLGLFLNAIKQRGKDDKSIPHGFFRDWMETNLPQISFKQLNVYMLLARGVCEKGKFEIRNFCDFEKEHNVLFVPGELPPPILKLVEGKTQNQLLLDFKQVEEDGDELRVKRGRLKGSRGNPKHIRDAGIALNEKERLEALQVRADEVADWLMENSDLARFGKMDEVARGAATLKKLSESIAYSHQFLTQLKKSRE